MKTLLSSSRRRLHCIAGLVALALIAFAFCAGGFTADALTAPELWIGGLAVGLVAERVQEGERRHHTPSGSDVTAGDVLQLDDGLAAVAINDISDGVQGAVHTSGIYKLTNVEGATTFSAGDDVSWDNGNNQAVAQGDAAADFHVGKAIAATSAGGDPVTVRLNAPALPAA